MTKATALKQPMSCSIPPRSTMRILNTVSNLVYQPTHLFSEFPQPDFDFDFEPSFTLHTCSLMADPLSIGASVLAIVTAAVQSVKLLNDTVARYKGRDRTLHRLQNELQDVSGILDTLKEAIIAEASISALLKGPVGRCSEVCQEFRQSMLSFSEKSKTGIRDWAKLEFMRGDINEFIDTISGYKSTIAVGLALVTLYVGLSFLELADSSPDAQPKYLRKL
jgi:hypothetical protein